MSKIIENVWLGNVNDSQNINFLKMNNINVIVNCTKDVPFINHVHFKYRIPVNDDLQEKSFDEMAVAMSYIIPVLVKHVERGDRILIHCHAGMQRSAIITLALLTVLTFPDVFKSLDKNTDVSSFLDKFYNKLIDHMKTCRPIVFTPGMNFKTSYHKWFNTYLQNYITGNQSF